MRAAHEALAHELTKTRSQATLRTRALRDENERLKLQLATQRERAVRRPSAHAESLQLTHGTTLCGVASMIG